jgi:hypothetical protein
MSALSEPTESTPPPPPPAKVPKIQCDPILPSTPRSSKLHLPFLCRGGGHGVHVNRVIPANALKNEEYKTLFPWFSDIRYTTTL